MNEILPFGILLADNAVETLQNKKIIFFNFIFSYNNMFGHLYQTYYDF